MASLPRDLSDSDSGVVWLVEEGGGAEVVEDGAPEGLEEDEEEGGALALSLS